MMRYENDHWVYYIKDTSNFNEYKTGKWMYFFEDMEFAKNVCKKAVEDNIVCEAKYSNSKTGVACFYLNCDDIEGHKKVISYFMQSNLIKRKKCGRYYDISFKLDKQTRAGQYGDDFKPILKLSDFINLCDGAWIR